MTNLLPLGQAAAPAFSTDRSSLSGPVDGWKGGPAYTRAGGPGCLFHRSTRSPANAGVRTAAPTPEVEDKGEAREGPERIHPYAGHPKLLVERLTHSYGRGNGREAVLDDVSFSLRPGEFVSVIGPSGCGKSTLLTILAGVLQPAGGAVVLDGEDIAGRPGQTGYMPQKDLLLPWKSVLDNTILGLRLAGTPRKYAREEARRWFPRFGLAGYEYAYPSTLSGGMRQRAALLRTVLTGKDLLLLDEPLGALDALTRAGMQEWLSAIARDFAKTVLLVTHDIDEAIFLSDRIYVMSARPGRMIDCVDVPLLRPREYERAITSQEAAALKRELLSALKLRTGD